jgi:hypothetical protein
MRRTSVRAAAALAGVALLAGCASANKAVQSGSGDPSGAGDGGGGMVGMNMGGSTTAATEVPSVNGIKPVPSQVLATADWQGMKIQARTMTPTTFVVFNGTREQLVKPTKLTSFHLMVLLSDAHTGVAIPYAGVWATISKDGKVVYDERQWPMISAFMGPHYGNNVQLPGAGHYQLKLLISPPVSARHLEYRNVWTKQHRVTTSFSWNPPS